LTLLSEAMNGVDETNSDLDFAPGLFAKVILETVEVYREEFKFSEIKIPDKAYSTDEGAAILDFHQSVLC